MFVNYLKIYIKLNYRLFHYFTFIRLGIDVIRKINRTFFVKNYTEIT